MNGECLRVFTRPPGPLELSSAHLQLPHGPGGAAGAERDDPSGWRRGAPALPGLPPPLRAVRDQHDVPRGPGRPAAVSLPDSRTLFSALMPFFYFQGAESGLLLSGEEAGE